MEELSYKSYKNITHTRIIVILIILIIVISWQTNKPWYRRYRVCPFSFVLLHVGPDQLVRVHVQLATGDVTSMCVHVQLATCVFMYT